MRLKLTLLLCLILTMTACAPAATATPLPATEAGEADPIVIPVTDIPVATEPTARSYSDPTYGFSFDYPAAWTLDVVSLGERAPQSIQLTSWQHTPGLIAEVPEGGTVMNVVVQLWDPAGDLEVFTQQRISAWEASDISIVTREALTLPDGRAAQEFVVRSVDSDGYFFFTTLGEQYLVISGSGDMDVIRQVARSVR